MTTKITLISPEEGDATVETVKAFLELSKEEKMDYLYKAKFAFEKFYNRHLKDYALEHGRAKAGRKYGASDVQKVL